MPAKGQELRGPGITLRILELDPGPVYEEGDSFDVPVATRHQMGPHEGPARVRWEVRPAQRTAEFFEQLYTGQAGENFLNEFSNEIRFDV
jgi:hypothetical protein